MSSFVCRKSDQCQFSNFKVNMRINTKLDIQIVLFEMGIFVRNTEIKVLFGFKAKTRSHEQRDYVKH